MAQAHRRAFAGPEDFLKFLGQSDDRNPPQAQRRQFRHRRVELPLAAVNYN